MFLPITHGCLTRQCHSTILAVDTHASCSWRRSPGVAVPDLRTQLTCSSRQLLAQPARALRQQQCCSSSQHLTPVALQQHCLLDSDDLGLRRDLLSRYHIGKCIGSGAYGVVNRGIEKTTGQEVAIKILAKIRGKLTREKTCEKLRKEIKLLTACQESRNVVQFLGAFEDDSHVYLVTEICNGGNLEDLLEEDGPFNERQTAAILYEALKTIAACHAKHVLHGDIKPANFLLKFLYPDPLGAIEAGVFAGAWLKAIDFGCGALVTGATLSRRIGTPVYMAPEIFRRDYGLAADLWSLGMMAYQLTTARFPFWDSVEACRSRTLEEVMKAVIVDDIPFDYGPWLDMSPEGLDLIQSLVERDPARRITAAQALEHPWFEAQLSYVGRQAEVASNIVPLTPAMPTPSSAPAPAAPQYGVPVMASVGGSTPGTRCSQQGSRSRDGQALGFPAGGQWAF